MLTQTYLKSVLDYDRETGEFVWLRSAGTRSEGSSAGHVRKDGYVTISIDTRAYKAHRLAWLYAHGYLPAFRIDHKDNNPSNNALDNLRPATHEQNLANQKRHSNNTSGFKGVSARGSKFRSYVNANKRRYWTGNFDTAKEAYEARMELAKHLHGEYVRFE